MTISLLLVVMRILTVPTRSEGGELPLAVAPAAQHQHEGHGCVLPPHTGITGAGRAPHLAQEASGRAREGSCLCSSLRSPEPPCLAHPKVGQPSSPSWGCVSRQAAISCEAAPGAGGIYQL